MDLRNTGNQAYQDQSTLPSFRVSSMRFASAFMADELDQPKEMILR